MAFDEFEPIGTRTVPDLLALLLTLLANVNRKSGQRAFHVSDFISDPLTPRRLSPVEEASRMARVAMDYRRLRAERLAKAHAAEVPAPRKMRAMRSRG